MKRTTQPNKEDKIMANKRTLKKSISLICDELMTECVAASLYGNKAHQDDAEALFYSIARMENDFIARISHPEPGMPQKKYFAILCEQFTSQVSELIDQINNL